jgi:DNA-binding GntR family transcriptional regulator
MEETVKDLKRVPEQDTSNLMAIDERFHALLYQAADNEFLSDTLLRLHALSFRLWHLVLDRLDGVKGAMEQHVEITHALELRDASRAEALIRKHVSEFQQRIKAVL